VSPKEEREIVRLNAPPYATVRSKGGFGGDSLCVCVINEKRARKMQSGVWQGLEGREGKDRQICQLYQVRSNSAEKGNDNDQKKTIKKKKDVKDQKMISRR